MPISRNKRKNGTDRTKHSSHTPRKRKTPRFMRRAFTKYGVPHFRDFFDFKQLKGKDQIHNLEQFFKTELFKNLNSRQRRRFNMLYDNIVKSLTPKRAPRKAAVK